MKLSEDEKNAVVIYRIQKAKDTLTEAEGIAQLKYWNSAINRLYYACYYATTALLIKNGFSAQTHSWVIRLFGLHFIARGLFQKSRQNFIPNFMN